MRADRAIINTLLYSDLFDFPLKKEELWFYLISNKTISAKEFNRSLSSLKQISRTRGYYYILGRRGIIEKREKKKKHNRYQVEYAKRIFSNIAKFPTVKLIGLSGSLAIHDSDEGDDIDIFVVSEKHMVWLTRLMIVLFLVSKGIYRKRNGNDPAGKFCMNMVVSEDYSFGNARHDLFTAHEIAQMLPLYDKDDAYVRFLDNNKWILNFLPNVTPSKKRSKIKRGLLGSMCLLLFRILFLERLSRIFQRIYMGKTTNEVIRNDVLAFHPNDYRQKILKSFKEVKI